MLVLRAAEEGWRNAVRRCVGEREGDTVSTAGVSAVRHSQARSSSAHFDLEAAGVALVYVHTSRYRKVAPSPPVTV